MDNPPSPSNTPPGATTRYEARPTGTVTFLFTDVEASTRGWEANPAAMQAAFMQQDAIIRCAIESNGGYAYKMIGDAFQAAFPTALGALQAAIDAQRALVSETWPAETGEVRVRMALHTGVTEERGDDYVGPLLNRVARLLSAAHGAQILLSEVTRDLVQDTLPPGVQLLDMGQHKLRDLTRPEHVFQVVASGAATAAGYPMLPSQFPPLKTLAPASHVPGTMNPGGQEEGGYQGLNNLPPQPTPLIGRERELAAVRKLLGSEEVRLLTLTGPGGTGKTRFGVQLASELLAEAGFSDGVWFVELAALTDPGLVASTVAQTLGVREAAGRPIIDTLKDYLSDKQLLLVLDNFEHLLRAVDEVTTLMRAAPGIKVLVTSRVKLNIYGEHEYIVPPLSLPDINQLHHHPPPSLQVLTRYEAVRLFIARAQAAKADFEVNNDNASAVAEICVRLDGLPLAIELAAARVRMLPPQALLARLSSSLPGGSSGRLKILTGGGKDLSSRQQTLRGTIDWSYNLLTAEEKQLFRRMAVFQGGCTLQALEEVCNSETLETEADLRLDVLDGVQSLVDESLLQQREGRGGEPYFWMLETIHDYAWEKLAESGEADLLQREHALYFMRLAEEAEPYLMTAEQEEWFDRLEDEYGNIRAALDWTPRNEWTSPIGGVDALQAVPIIGLRIVGAIGRFWHVRGYFNEGRERFSTLLELDTSSGTQVGNAFRAKALSWAAILAWEQGDLTSARSLHEESLAIARQLGNKWRIAFSLNSLGNVLFEQGDRSLALSMYQESFAIRRELGDKWGMGISLNSLGTAAQNQGDYTAARSLYEESLALVREVGDKWVMAVPLHNLGTVAQQQGDYTAARSLFEKTLAMYKELGDRQGIAYALAGLGGVEVARVQFPAKPAVPTAQEEGTDNEDNEDNGGKGSEISATDRLRRGARLLGAVEALLESLGAVLWSEDRRPTESAAEYARAQLGDEEFEKVRAEGRDMSIEEAIEYALEDRADSQT